MSEIFIGNRKFDLINTHTAFSQRNRINPRHENHLKTASSWLRRSRRGFIFGGDINMGCNLQLQSSLPEHVDRLWYRAFFDQIKERCAWAGTPGVEEVTLDVNNPLHAHPWTVQFVVRSLLPWLHWDMPSADVDHILVDRLKLGIVKHRLLFQGGGSDFKSLTIQPLSDHYCRHALVELVDS